TGSKEITVLADRGYFSGDQVLACAGTGIAPIALLFVIFLRRNQSVFREPAVLVLRSREPACLVSIVCPVILNLDNGHLRTARLKLHEITHLVRHSFTSELRVAEIGKRRHKSRPFST